MSSTVFAETTVEYSRILARNTSGLTDTCLASIGANHRQIWVGTRAAGKNANSVTSISRAQAACAVSDFSRVEISEADQAMLDTYAAAGTWAGFSCSADEFETDKVFLQLSTAQETETAENFLNVIWSTLREDCLHEITGQAQKSCDDALLWMIQKKIDVAVMILNADGLLLRANTAAKVLLKDGDVLRPGRFGIIGAKDIHTKTFRNAVNTCATTTPDAGEEETLIFLESRKSGRSVPVTLSRYPHKGKLTDLVTVVLPAPPETRAVERLAKGMGLTPSEARVAALLQMGLSNRDVSKVAGLTEQSCSTYSKRVLSKLNVSSRAEMAQLLTWQAYGGRGQ